MSDETQAVLDPPAQPIEEAQAADPAPEQPAEPEAKAEQPAPEGQAKPKDEAEEEYRHKLQEEMADTEEELQKSDAKIEAIKERLKEEKEYNDGLVVKLRRKAKALREPIPPLFQGQAAEADEEEEGDVVDADFAVDSDAERAAEDETWKQALLSEIFAGLPSKCVSACHEQDLQTLGQLTDWLNSDKKLTDLQGIGNGKAKQMEDAVTAYFDRRTEASIEAAPRK